MENHELIILPENSHANSLDDKKKTSFWKNIVLSISWKKCLLLLMFFIIFYLFIFFLINFFLKVFFLFKLNNDTTRECLKVPRKEWQFYWTFIIKLWKLNKNVISVFRV